VAVVQYLASTQVSKLLNHHQVCCFHSSTVHILDKSVAVSVVLGVSILGASVFTVSIGVGVVVCVVLTS